MPEKRLTFNPGFKPGTKLFRMPDSSLKLVHMPEGGLTLDPGVALWNKAQQLFLLFRLILKCSVLQLNNGWKQIKKTVIVPKCFILK